MDSMWLIGMCGYSIPVPIIPFIVGGGTLIGKSPRVHRFAGWYTFKPIIATPIAILIFSESVDKFFYQDKFFTLWINIYPSRWITDSFDHLAISRHVFYREQKGFCRAFCARYLANG